MSDLLSTELPPEAGREEDTSFIEETDAAYLRALASVEEAAVLVGHAANLHVEARERIRASMRSGGSLNFGEHCPQNIQRRSALDPRVKDVLRSLHLELARW